MNICGIGSTNEGDSQLDMEDYDEVNLFVSESGDDFIKITRRILIEVQLRVGVWGSYGRDPDKLPASCSSKISLPN